MWGVPLSAGLPSDARAEVVPENSLRGLTAASFKQLRQVSQRCALRAPTSALRSSAPTRRPASSQPKPLGAPLVACPEPATVAWHQRGKKAESVAGGAPVWASQARRPAQVCPLPLARGWRACLSPQGELRSHLGWTKCRRAVPRSGTAHMKPCQPPTRLRPALQRQNARTRHCAAQAPSGEPSTNTRNSPGSKAVHSSLVVRGSVAIRATRSVGPVTCAKSTVTSASCRRACAKGCWRTR